MENLVETIRHQLGGGAVRQMSSIVNEDEGKTRTAFETAVPVSMAGLASQASTEEGARSLLETFQSGRYPHVEPEDLGKTLSDPGSAVRMTSSSEGFLGRMFGTRLDGVLDGLASFTGVSRSSATRLLGLATPLVMGLVGKRAAGQHLDARGLSGFLRQQGDLAAGLLPDRFSGLLGMRPAMVGAPAAAVTTHGPRRVEIPHRDVPHRRRILPWVVAGLAALAAVLLLATRYNRQRTAQQVTAPVTAPQVETPPAVPQAQQPAVPQPAAPAQVETVAQGAIGPFQRAVEQGGGDLPQRFVVQGLEFETDSAVIRPETATVLDEVAGVMKAKPSVAIRAEGHTDATGDLAANQALSTGRANAVKDYLVAQGVPADRVATAGFADEQPIGTNDTSEGRAINRRTEIVLVQR
jgi:OOP family OmpA-OmpF porin